MSLTDNIAQNVGTIANLLKDESAPVGEVNLAEALESITESLQTANAIVTPAQAVADSTGIGDVVVQFNKLLANLRTVGLLKV